MREKTGVMQGGACPTSGLSLAQEPHFCPGDYRAAVSVWGPDSPSQALLGDWVPDLTVVGAAQILSQELLRP